MIGRENRTAIGLNAKRPQPGRVKTRLSPPLTPIQAAELYEALVLDLADRLSGLRDVDLVLFYDPPQAAKWFESQVGPRWQLVAQCAGDLGARLTDQAIWLAERGYAAFALLGSDAPTMPLGSIRWALTEIAQSRADVVLGPDQDGGYYLVAQAPGVSGLFDRVAWSGPTTLRDTESNALREGWRVVRAQTWYDVDRGPDLDRLRSEVKAADVAAEVPRTATWLRRHETSSAGTPGPDTCGPIRETGDTGPK